jgi:predicted kinase
MTDVVEEALGELLKSRPEFLAPGRGPRRLVIMSGLPFSGKSHLTSKIQERSASRVLVVRSDDVRPLVAQRMGRSAPQYDEAEHRATFELGGRLVRLALGNNNPVIADATNLSERFRQWAAEPARDAGAEAVVVFVRAGVGTAIDRAMAGGPARHGSTATSSVYRDLRGEMEPHELCTLRHLIFVSEGDVGPFAETLANWLNGFATETLGAIPPAQRDGAGNRL